MRPSRFRAALMAALTVVALVGCAPSSRATATPDEPTEAPASSAAAPTFSAEPSVPDDPSAEPTPSPSSPSSSVDPSPSASAGSGAAAGCSGSDENRQFFEAAAGTLTWTVYCATLPAGWFVDAGEYRRAGGGRLEISYGGPGGARLELHEGAFCADGGGCVPSGTESGDAPFGDKTGTLIATDDGGWAVVVDRGEAISWLAVGSGIDENAFRAITSALAAVDG
jgi:hypothetical protein